MLLTAPRAAVKSEKKKKKKNMKRFLLKTKGKRVRGISHKKMYFGHKMQHAQLWDPSLRMLRRFASSNVLERTLAHGN